MKVKDIKLIIDGKTDDEEVDLSNIFTCDVCKKRFVPEGEYPESFNGAGGDILAVFCESCAGRVSQFIFETLPYTIR